MAQEKRNYRKKQTENFTTAALEMGNVPPQAIDIEEAVLGAMMVSREYVNLVMDKLTPESF